MKVMTPIAADIADLYRAQDGVLKLARDPAPAAADKTPLPRRRRVRTGPL